jgi:hypothetical protein
VYQLLATGLADAKKELGDANGAVRQFNETMRGRNLGALMTVVEPSEPPLPKKPEADDDDEDAGNGD